MVRTKLHIPPLLDIQSAEFARQYQLGAHWARYGDGQGHGPRADTSVIENLTRDIRERPVHTSTALWPRSLGFSLGLVHGSVLDPQTGTLRPTVTTLVTLSDPQFIRGYHAGRVWFFYEAEPHERRLTDTALMQRLYELATEYHQYWDAQGTINFALGCLLGELSGHLLPLTADEQKRIQEEDRHFAEDEAQRAKASQEQGNEPLSRTILQEA